MTEKCNKLSAAENNWGWEHQEDAVVENLQLESPATLSLNNHFPSSSSSRGTGAAVSMGCPLEEATEYEYLRNILYQYMLGKESQTLARVLATVVKFSPEQVAKIEQHEERKNTVLGSLGLSGGGVGGVAGVGGRT